MTKISQYTTMTTLQSADLFDVSEQLTAAPTWGSRAISYANLLVNLQNDLTGIVTLGAATQVPYVNGAANDFDYSANFTFNGSILTLTGTALLPSQNELRLGSGGVTYNALKSPAVMAGNITYTLPDAAPTTNGQVLASTTGGVMSWADNTAPVVLYADNLAELTSAFATLNTAGIAGIVKLGAQISLVADLTLNFGTGIELHGGSNALASSGTWKVIVQGSKFTFYNVIFRGTNDFINGGVGTPENTDSQAFIQINDATCARGVFLDCEFQDVIGGSNGANTTASTAPINFIDCANYSRFILSNIWITTKETALTNNKPYGPVSVLYGPGAGNQGCTINCDNWALSASTITSLAIPNANEPWINYQGAMKVKVTGTAPTAYATVTVDQTLTLDSASSASWYKYPTMWGSNLILENVDPTTTNTEGTQSDILVNGTDVFIKHTDIAPNAGDTNWHNVTHKSVKSDGLGAGGGTYALTLADANKFFASPPTIGNTTTFRLPANALVPFKIGTEIAISRMDRGNVQVDPAVGVNLYNPSAPLAPTATTVIPGQYIKITIKKIATDDWMVYGTNFLG